MNLQMMVTYIAVDFFCIIIAVTMWLNIKSDFGSEFEVKSLRRALTSYVCFLVLGLVWMLIQDKYIAFNQVTGWLANSLSLICMSLTTYFWFLFAMARIRRNGKRPGRFSEFICMIPIVLEILLCLTTQINGWVFRIAADGTYQKGPLFVFTSSLQYFYSICVCIYGIWYGVREKNHDKRNLCFLISSFILFPMFAGIIEIIIGGTPIMAPAIITALFIVFAYTQRSQIYNDSLTGLNNRRRLISLLEYRLAQTDAQHPLAIYILDANNFKKINDKHGHAEGDNALITISESMRRLAGEYNLFVSRFGGDEFVIVDYNTVLNNPRLVIDRFNSILKHRCEEKELEYYITAAIGYTIINNSDIQPEEAIKSADKMLYDKKKSRVHHRY